MKCELLFPFMIVLILATANIDSKSPENPKTPKAPYNLSFELKDGLKFDECCEVNIFYDWKEELENREGSENAMGSEIERELPKYEGTTKYRYSVAEKQGETKLKVEFKSFSGLQFNVDDKEIHSKYIKGLSELKGQYIICNPNQMNEIDKYSSRLKSILDKASDKKDDTLKNIIMYLLDRPLVLFDEPTKPINVNDTWQGNPPLPRQELGIAEDAITYTLSSIKEKNKYTSAVITLKFDIDKKEKLEKEFIEEKGSGTGEIEFDLTNGVPLSIQFKLEHMRTIASKESKSTETSRCETKTTYKYKSFGKIKDKTEETSAKIDTIEFDADDGLKITGDMIKADSDKAIICVHMYPGSRKDYHKIMPKLADAGYSVLSIDTRGCPKGNTGKEKYEELYNKFSPELFKIIYKDVLTAKKFLIDKYKIDKNKVGLIGGSIGCSVVLMSAVEDESFNTLVLMSPGIDWAEIDNIDNMKNVGKRRILITYGDKEKDYADNIDKLKNAATDECKIKVKSVKGNAHAGYQFEKNPEIILEIVDFIKAYLK